ncbi:NAD(P)H-dependent glycerol-3-phosphate dehydrogenase [Actibacterium ureilyticum]|uniref:NAD(P)H-dependent glycerol-3-phosphate dehydrogenase n=1 Tax=Actibacterium ureilyticum TaxID=1590614 RepID=UPI000BAB0B16|nr:NAD(P)H-dependent glycerol-3-phosphate dehydrogenase [Actibacterium ureilyticum]
MSEIAVIGAGAFGSALAVALARDGRKVALWGRDAAQMETIAQTRQNTRALPGIDLPEGVTAMPDLAQAARAETCLLAVPMQSLAGFLAEHWDLFRGKALVACCKGVDLTTGQGPSAVITTALPDARPAILTGPSFAADIARGQPTALTLACADEALGTALQQQLSTASLRLYLSPDVAGAELGGALKNVIAIAAGLVIGAGYGDSARAALMTRGFAEMQRFALARGARAETLAGLSGLGDLILTCTSDLSRNFCFGRALGRAEGFDPTITVEGAATARAVDRLATEQGIDMPITRMVTAVIDHRCSIADAAADLFSRPLKKE